MYRSPFYTAVDDDDDDDDVNYDDDDDDDDDIKRASVKADIDPVKSKKFRG